MKILNLKIISPQGEIVRSINFAEAGISIILADIKKKEDFKETINSLGKTLLLKMVDYLFGSNNDKSYFKEEIKGYVIEGTIKYREAYYLCSRILGSPENNSINKKRYGLDEYKSFFSISRGFLDKQIFLEEKNNLISPRSNPGCSDYLDFLTLLKLEEVGEKARYIYTTQDKISGLKDSRRLLLGSHGSSKPSKLEEEIFLLDKRVEEYEEKLSGITKKIETIQTVDLKEDVFDEFSNKNIKLKEIIRNMELKKIEKERLERFMEESRKTDITSEDVLAIYNQAAIEVPDMVKKEIQKVQEFHEKVYLERKDYLSKQIVELEKGYGELEQEFKDIAAKVDRLGKLISENKAYKEAILYYEKFTKELNDLKFKQGQLFQLKNIQKDIDNKSRQLTKYFEEAKDILEKKKELVDCYTNFIYELVRLIYNEDVSAYFDIKIRDRHLTRRPVEVVLQLRGDTGEGVGNVRKLLIDYLVFYYNEELDILIQDSSCYNGIDPRQVASMIKELDALAKKANKQAIVSLNKYQIAYDGENERFLKQNSSLVLSEKEKLLGFSF